MPPTTTYSGCVEQALSTGTPALAAVWMTPAAMPGNAGPITTLAPASSNSCVTVPPSAGSLFISLMMSSICWPSMPPALLIWSTSYFIASEAGTSPGAASPTRPSAAPMTTLPAGLLASLVVSSPPQPIAKTAPATASAATTTMANTRLCCPVMLLPLFTFVLIVLVWITPRLRHRRVPPKKVWVRAGPRVRPAFGTPPMLRPACPGRPRRPADRPGRPPVCRPRSRAPHRARRSARRAP